MKPCRVNGCERRVRRIGLCSGHLRGGETTEVAPRFPAATRDADGLKRCNICKQWLHVDLFTKDVNQKGGRTNFCRPCHTERRRMSKYGVPAGWLEDTLARQGGCCAICRSTEPRGRGWAIDHDHACCPGTTSCGECVRSVLCSPCNLALGLMGDDPDRLRRAADYIGWHGRLSIEPDRTSIVRGV